MTRFAETGRRHWSQVLLVGFAASLIILTGCSRGAESGVEAGGGEPASSQPGDSDGMAAPEVATDMAEQESADRSGGEPPSAGTDPSTVVPVQLEERALIRTATIRVDAEDVVDATRDAEAAVRGINGFVELSDVRIDDDGTATRSDLVLRVPTEEFDTVLDQLRALGSVRSENVGVDDVSEEIVDVESRIASQQASIERVRALLAEATEIGDVILIESELAAREAELESLQARISQLTSLTSLATISLTISVPSESEEPEEADAGGFVAGLQSGWSALVAVTTTVVTGLGVILPFVGVALVLLVPAAVWLRVRRSRRLGQPPAAPQPSGA